MTLRITLIDEEGNQKSWDRPYIPSFPGVSSRPGDVLWGNVTMLAGVVARDVEAGGGLLLGGPDPNPLPMLASER